MKTRIRRIIGPVIGVIVVGGILGRFVQIFGSELLTPAGGYAFFLFALVVVVLCADFFVGASNK